MKKTITTRKAAASSGFTIEKPAKPAEVESPEIVETIEELGEEPNAPMNPDEVQAAADEQMKVGVVETPPTPSGKITTTSSLYGMLSQGRERTARGMAMPDPADPEAPTQIQLLEDLGICRIGKHVLHELLGLSHPLIRAQSRIIVPANVATVLIDKGIAVLRGGA